MITALQSAYTQAPLILAQAGDTGSAQEAEVTSTLGPIWDMLLTAMQAIGAIVVIVGLVKIGMKAMQGKAQGAFRESLSLLLVGAFMFNIGLVFSIMAGAGNIVEALLTAFSNIAGSGGS